MDQITSIRVTKGTIELLKPYKKTYGTYERAIKELIAYFEEIK